MFNKEEVQRSLPSACRSVVSDSLVDTLNSFRDPDLVEAYRDNFYLYTSILADGRYKLGDYINATKYITYRLMGYNITGAYEKAFPDKYLDMVKRGCKKDHISAIASSYNKNKLVSGIYEKTLIPVHVLNADIHQKAINVLAGIMVDNEASHRSQIDAASALLGHLKAPEVAKIQLDVNHKDDSAISDLKGAMAELAQRQKMMLENSVVGVQEIVKQKLVVDNAN